jgi:hypothetical protein
MRRRPDPRFDVGVTASDGFLTAYEVTPWTNAGGGTAVGVTVFESVDAALVPIAFVAVTEKLYDVPLVSPEIVVWVAGGLPDTMVGVCATDATYGVTV